MTASAPQLAAAPPPDASVAKRYHRQLIWFYLLGSAGAVVVTLFLVFIGLELNGEQWNFLLIAVPFIVTPYLAFDVYLIGRQYGPLGSVLAMFDAGESPDNRAASRAIVRALNLPYLSFVRVTFIHGPAAAGMVLIALLVGNALFDTAFAFWQIATLCATILFFAAPTHAIIEYFVIARSIVPILERLWRYCARIEPQHQRRLIAIRLKNKLLYLSIFIAALPLLFFAASIVFKVDLLFRDLNYAISFADMLPLLTWVVGVVFVCLSGALVMSILTANEVSRSAAKLIGAMTEVENGELDNTLFVTGTDEYAELFRGFNLMTESLREEVRILELSKELAGELNLDTLLARIISVTSQLLDADRSTLLLYDRKNNELWSRVAEGLTTREIRVPPDQGIAGAVFTSGKTENIADAYSDPRFNQAVDKKTGYRTNTILCMPIVNKAGERLGVTQVLNKNGGRFTVKDENRLAAFTAQITVALENAQLFEDVLNEKQYNDSILRSTSSGVITLDPDNKILTANDSVLKLLKTTREAVVGNSVHSVFEQRNPWILNSLERVLRSGGQDYVADADLKLDGKQSASVNMSVMPLIDVNEETIGSMIVLDDISGEKRLRTTMSRYMSAEVVDELLEQGEAQLGGKAQQVTILFSDLRNFTTISEALGARETVSMLNEYFEDMVEVIFYNKGVLDKYIGDAIMALFGVPFAGEQDADNAVQTANDMFVALRSLNVRRAKQDRSPIDIGVGVSSGEVVAGNIGSPKRMEYTVIGDSVNLASRLEGATKAYGAKILLSEYTVKALKRDFALREMDLLRVKGKTEPVAIYEAMDHYDEAAFPNMPQVLDAFKHGVAAYREQRWHSALAEFESALKLHPGDRPSQAYSERVQFYRDNPPPQDWDGVWIMRQK